MNVRMNSGARVLVVDDEYPLRRLLRTYLEKGGFSASKQTTVSTRLA